MSLKSKNGKKTMSELALDQRNLESETNTEPSQETENLPAEESSLNDANSVPESVNPIARFVESARR